MLRVLIPGFSDAVLDQFTYAELNDEDASQRFIGHFPHGSSVRQTVHYGQLIMSDKFQKFDYHNFQKNIDAYGQPTPPELPIESIDSVPIVMISALYDRIVNVDMNRKMAERIPAVEKHYELEADHLTFLAGKDMDQILSISKGFLDKHAPLG